MSAIVAIFHRDGRPADTEEISRLVDVIRPWGPDRAGWVVDGPVGLGHVLLATTPEATLEGQPVQVGPMLAVVDGRLDNRTELRAHVLASGRPEPITDADFVVAAYERWGTDFASHLLGDVAAIVWDARHRHLVCTRDHIGLRPLHYAEVGPTLVVSTDLKALTTVGGVDLEPNEGVVAEYLAGWRVSETETLYRGIFRLPQAHTLVAGTDRIVTRRYWHPSFEPAPRRDIREDVEEYRELLDQAIRCRLRSTGTCAVSLSGGIDSSSISALAERSSRLAGGTPGIEAYSLVFPGHPVADESRFIDEVSAWTGVPSTTVRVRPRPVSVLDREVERYADLPDGPTARFDILPRPPDPRRRVMLSGNGGDDLFLASAFVLAERLLHADPVGWARALHTTIRSGLISSARGALLTCTARPILEPWAPAFFHKRDIRSSGATALAHPTFARRAGLTERTWRQPLEVAPVVRQRWPAFYGGEAASGYERTARRAAHAAFDLRHPFLDLRLIEFALGLPEDRRLRDGDFRWIQREAMRGWLPPPVLDRRDKAEFSVLFREELAALGGRSAFSDKQELQVVERGWVDRGAVLRAYDAVAPPSGPAIDSVATPDRWVSRLWTVLALDRWARSIPL